MTEFMILVPHNDVKATVSTDKSTCAARNSASYRVDLNVYHKEFPSNDDNLEETVVPVKPPPKKKKSKKKKQQRLSHSATSTQIEIADTLSEDSHNTIDSNQASYDLTNEEGRRQIPPSFVRYRVGILLDNVDLINNTAADATEQISPSDQYKVILKDLVS